MTPGQTAEHPQDPNLLSFTVCDGRPSKALLGNVILSCVTTTCLY